MENTITAPVAHRCVPGVAVAPPGTVFGDDTWRLVLRRQGGAPTVSVDGAYARM
ncbi:hypothetical protein [Streptomyces sp. NPDC003943]